jgi:DNA (cytosine-5)-methyltransferase 1
MTSPPCQSFSLAGKRKGEDSKNGVLFYNSHEFIVKNKPRFFIFENVKGLLSDDNGKTFQKWIDYLGGKSVNGNPVIFPHEMATPYHVYYQVMNAKHYGVPQNRERIFIVGIRDDADNNFSFSKPFPLLKRLKDVLESEVDEKYFLSDTMLNYFKKNSNSNKTKGNGFSFKPKAEIDLANSVTTKSGNRMDDNYIKIVAIRGRNPQNPKSRVSGLETEQMLEINENGTSNALTTVQKDNVVVIPANNSKGRIRRLTPSECFRLMDFNENFKWNVSDSQAYKQAGNSIVVSCLVEIIKKLNL